MDQGSLVPDEVVFGMIENKLQENQSAAGFIFDGFPRTVPQAEALDELLAQYNTQIKVMVALVVDEDELTKRLLIRGQSSGRPDDQNEALIHRRIKEYNDKTAPVASYYESQGKFKAIGGIGNIEKIFQAICAEIETVTANVRQ